MSKVFVAGGSGRVATDLIKDLVTAGNDVVAGARHPEKVIKLAGVTPVNLDLHSDVAKIATLMAGSDAVYFVAGSRGKDLLQTDAMGAVKTMLAAQRAGVKRYIMLSSMYALQPEKWADYPALASITDYNIAKFFADNYLIHNTVLDYAILQPTVMTDKPGTGKITVDEGKFGYNPAEDVARTLADILKYQNTSRKIIKMREGDTPIDDALSRV